MPLESIVKEFMQSYQTCKKGKCDSGTIEGVNPEVMYYTLVPNFAMDKFSLSNCVSIDPLVTLFLSLDVL